MDTIFTKEQIKEIIPHREPMLMIDEIVEMKAGKSIIAKFYLDPKYDFFRGHFPEEPVMPGVLTVESMAQTADVLLLLMPEFTGKIPLFLGIDNVRFRKKVRPGDTIEIQVNLSEVREERGVAQCDAMVFNGGELSATGTVKLAMR